MCLNEYVPSPGVREAAERNVQEAIKSKTPPVATALCRWCWVRMTTKRLHKHVDVCKCNPDRESE